MNAAAFTLLTYEQWASALADAESFHDRLIDEYLFRFAVQDRTPEEDAAAAECAAEIAIFEQLIAFFKFGIVS